MTPIDPTGEGIPFDKREMWNEMSVAAKCRVAGRWIFETTGRVPTGAELRGLLLEIDPRDTISRAQCSEALRRMRDV